MNETPNDPLPGAFPSQPGATPTTEPPPISPASPPDTSTGLTPNVAAFLAVLFTLVGGIVFLAIEKRNAYVRFWAVQSIALSVAWIILTILTIIVGVVFIGPLVLLLILWKLAFNLAFLVVYLFMLYSAATGSRWEVPVFGKITREQIDRMLPKP